MKMRYHASYNLLGKTRYGCMPEVTLLRENVSGRQSCVGDQGPGAWHPVCSPPAAFLQSPILRSKLVLLACNLKTKKTERRVLPYNIRISCKGMTKRKRTPSSSPPPRARVPFQIPPSLQRLSMISRSLAHQSDKLARVSQDEQNARVIALAQPLGEVLPSVAATSGGTESRDGQAQGFRAFAPPKQPSFPDTQTWVVSKPRRSHVPDNAGFMPPTQPSFPQGEAGPQPQPRSGIPSPQPQPHKAATPAVGPELAPQPIPSEATLANLEPPAADGEVLCLETQPNRIAALIAQKRAANEANHRREIWVRQQAAHRISSQAPDDQLLNELNSAAGHSAKGHSSVAGQAGRARTGQHQAVGNLDQYAIPTPVITFDPIVPSTGMQTDNRKTGHVKKGSTGSKEPTRGPTSAPATKSAELTKETSPRDHNSLFSSSASTTPSPDGRSQAADRQTQDPQQQPNQHGSFTAQVSAAGSSAPPIDANSKSISPNSAKHKTNSRYPDSSFVRQPNQSNHSTPVAAGYYRFKPKHWQTNSSTQPEHQQQIQALSPATQSGYQRIESSVWPASRDMPQKTPPNPVFRNLTQDRFGRFGVGGKLKEAVGQPSGAGA
jgi:hypothetical protein